MSDGLFRLKPCCMMSDSQDIQKCCLPLLPKYQIKTNRLKGLKHFRLGSTDRQIFVSLKNADIENISWALLSWAGLQLCWLVKPPRPCQAAIFWPPKWLGRLGWCCLSDVPPPGRRKWRTSAGSWEWEEAGSRRHRQAESFSSHWLVPPQSTAVYSTNSSWFSPKQNLVFYLNSI